MSVENKLGRSLLDLSEVIKSNVITAMARAKSEGKTQISDRDLAALAETVGSEVERTVRGSMDGILLTLKQR